MTYGGMRVLVDADVLWKRSLRDWILMMSDACDDRSMYSVCWTEDVVAETVSRLRDKYPENPSGALEDIGNRLRGIWSNSQISRFESALDSFIGQDLGDLHLHSAAVAGGVDIIVSGDKSGLLPPKGEEHLLDSLPYEVMNPDDFLMLVHQQATHIITDCAKAQIKHFMESNRTNINLVEKLDKAGAPRFADKVRWMLVQM